MISLLTIDMSYEPKELIDDFTNVLSTYLHIYHHKEYMGSGIHMYLQYMQNLFHCEDSL